MSPRESRLSATEMAERADECTLCLRYSGGDPTPQIAHAPATSRLMAARGLRICWDTNSSMHPALLDQMIELSLRNGGRVTFDLKV